MGGEVTSSAYPASPAATPVRHRIILALPRPYRVLRGNHALAFLVTGQALSSLADWLLALALAVLAYTASHSATIVALLTVTRLLPYGLVLPLAGAVLDRCDRRKLMVGVGVGRALCMLCLLLVQSPTTLPLVFPIAFLSASLSTLLRPTINAALPTMVAAEDWLPANSLLSQLDSLSHVAGPALGGLLVLLGALPLAFLLTAVAFALSAVAFLWVRLPQRAATTRPQVEDVRGEVIAGFRFLFRDNEGVLAALTLTAAGLILMAGAYYALAAVLTQKTFHLGSQGIGFLEATYSVGGILGSLLVGPATRGRRIGRVVMAGAALSALATALFGLSPAGVWPFVCIAVIGVADIVVQVCATTLLQAATPPELLGRTFIAFEAALICAMLLGALTAGPLLHVLGPRGATVAFALLGGTVLLVCRPRLRRMEDVLGLRADAHGTPQIGR
jgi:MFS family permease